MDHPCLYDVASIIYRVVNVLSWFTQRHRNEFNRKSNET